VVAEPSLEQVDSRLQRVDAAARGHLYELLQQLDHCLLGQHFHSS
jgi:hypothetical protein